LKNYTDLFVAFLSSPNKESFIKLRDVVISHETYAPYDDTAEDNVETLYSKGEYEKVIEGIKKMMPNWLLSPRIHLLYSMAGNKLGDKSLAEMEMYICQACIDGILSTGDGFEESPFLVTRILDEYDVLMRMGKEMRAQSLVEKNERYFDCIQCTDGTEIMFDITDCYSHLQQEMTNP
jgi:hypothetical protein